MAKVADELRKYCVGHPYAKVPWPHRAMNEAADLIDELEGAAEDAQRALEMLIKPKAIEATTADHAYTHCVSAERRLRAALARAKGEPDA